MVAGQDVLVFTHHTLAYHLLNGYCRLTRIPHNDEEVVKILEGDEGGSINIPPTFNDLTAANPTASSS